MRLRISFSAQTASLLACFCLLARAPAASQDESIERIREHALTYANQLPDFRCDELIRRYHLPSDPFVSTPPWILDDTIVTQLTYFDGRENYLVTERNGKQVRKQNLDDLGGSITSGEFGTMLERIFRPETNADFRWSHAKKLGARKIDVLKYSVEQANSRYEVISAVNGRIFFPAYKGQIYIDAESGSITRVTLTASGMPPDFLVQYVTTTLDYGKVEIAGHQYMLPLRAEVIANHDDIWTRNLVEFKAYKKYSVDVKLTIDQSDLPHN